MSDTIGRICRWSIWAGRLGRWERAAHKDFFYWFVTLWSWLCDFFHEMDGSEWFWWVFLHSATICKMLPNVLRVRRKSRCRNWTWEFCWSNNRTRNEKKKYRDNFFSLLRILKVRWHSDNYGKDPARVHRGNVGMPLLNWSKLPE